MAAVLVMAAIGVWAVGTHQISYVVTSGISMQPVYYEKDLVFIRPSDSYEIGQIAAYHGPGGVEVLHRIIGGDAATGFVFKGDNNESIDVDKPTADELIGRAALHVPRGGVWLGPLLSPTSLGIVGFLFVGSKATTARNRREIARGRRKKQAKVRGMSTQGGSWAAAAAVIKAVSRMHPAMRVLAAIAAISSIAGMTLGVLGWMKPTSEAVRLTGESGESMTFSYSAEVPRSAAYDGTTVFSPDPVFRKLAKVVDLKVAYQGAPGRIEIIGRLSAENGWHTALQFSQPKQFATDRYTDSVRLDLDALERRATAAGEAIGVDLAAVTVEVAANVRHNDGSAFQPKLILSLAPVQLSLVNGPTSLIVDQSSAASGSSVQTRYIGAFGYKLLPSADARRYSVLLILGGLAVAGFIAMTALRAVPLRTRVQIQRRYPHLLVPVEPMASPPGKPVVIVDTFPALVKLAEKYGQMILTWTRPDGADDFVVRDEGILYRYRIEPSTIAAPMQAEPRQASATVSVQVAAEAAPPPALQLPPAPEPPPDVQPERPDSETGEVTATKAPPRKRASRTTAAKAAATKTTATKRAPAKRTRAQAKAAEPEAAAVPQVEISPDAPPALAVDDLRVDVEDQKRSASAVATADTVAELAAPAVSTEETASTTVVVMTVEPTTESERQPETDSVQVDQEAEEQPTPPQPESGREDLLPDVAGIEVRAAEAASPGASAPPQPETPEASDSRPLEASEPDPVKEPAPAEEAREAMEDLAERNLPIKEPELKEPNESEPDPNREPIYDFLPAAKRTPAPPDPDEEP